MIHIEEFWQMADGDNWAPAFLRAQHYFPDGHGLRTHFLGSYQPDLRAGSQLVIDGLWLQGNGTGSGFAHHGIYADGGDGLQVEAASSRICRGSSEGWAAKGNER